MFPGLPLKRTLKLNTPGPINVFCTIVLGAWLWLMINCPATPCDASMQPDHKVQPSRRKVLVGFIATS